ncbi:MAG: hypothetical protein HYR60_32495, partial [Acidobacteria bacterium]|nr:hypothetical protein [Acidobacteriota bacterium]
VRPGVVTLAHPAPVGKTALAMEFVRRCAPEFQDVFWLSCGRRSIAGQAGDLAAQLGLRLPGDARTNLGALRDFCAPRRLLIVLDDVEERASIQLVPGGRCSALLTTRQSEFACGERIALEPVVPLTPRLEEDEDALARALQLSGAQEPAPLQRALDWALPRAGGQPEVYALATVLARRAIAVSTRQGRLAEAFEILERVIPIAEATQDWRLLEDLTREQIWILEAWDRLEEAAQRRWLLTSLEASQTTFDFS